MIDDGTIGAGGGGIKNPLQGMFSDPMPVKRGMGQNMQNEGKAMPMKKAAKKAPAKKAPKKKK